MGTHVYDTPPKFIKGHAIVLGFLLTAIITVCLLMWWMHRENKRKDAELREYEERGEIHPHRGRSLEEEHDYHIDFRYVL